MMRRAFRSGSVFLFSAAACLASGGAGAQVPVTDYIVVQPIDVCSTSGLVCPVVNNLGQTANTNPGTTQIGFIDPLTGVNITDAIWSQNGIRVTFLPLVKYSSPSNPLGNPLTQPDYRWLHVCNCGSGAGACAHPAIPSCSTGSSSNDFMTLSQQPSISTGVVPNPTTPPGGTQACTVANGVLQPPCVPVSTNPPTINLFFVNTIVPATPGLIIKGFSWDNGNGSAIASSQIFSLPSSPDTIAHELGHVLGLEHTTFQAGPLTCPAPYPNSFCPENLMTAGSAVRQVPSGLINSSSVNCPGAAIGEACWVPQVPPQNTTQPNALDLMTMGGSCTIANPSACPSQEAAVLLSGFLNPIASSTTTATDPASSNTITFNVTGASAGRSHETLLAWALVLPPSAPGVTTAFGSPTASPPNLIQDADFPNGDSDNNVGGVYYLGTWSSTCAGEGARCLIVEFNTPGAAAGDSVNFKMSFTSSVTNASLCGAEIIYLFNDGSIHPTPFPCSESATVTTTSQMADLTMPVEIASPAAFTGATNLSCIPLPGGTACAPPTSVSDSNLRTGVESGPICLAHGQVVPCP
jgi:hypothetical protein